MTFFSVFKAWISKTVMIQGGFFEMSDSKLKQNSFGEKGHLRSF